VIGALQQTRQRCEPALAMVPTSLGNDVWESLALAMAKNKNGEGIKLVLRMVHTSYGDDAHKFW